MLRRTPVMMGLLTVLAAGQSAAQQSSPDPLIPRAVLNAPPLVEAPRLSPDGQLLSAIMPLDGVPNLFVAPVNDITAARPVTHDSGRGVQWYDVSGNITYHWTADSKHLVYLRDNNGDENFNLYRVNVVTGDTRNLTAVEDAQVRLLRLSDSRPHEALIAINDRNPRWHDPYLINVVTGERRLLEENNRFVAYVGNHNLELRIAITVTDLGGFVLYRSAGGGRWEVATELDNTEALPDGVGFAADNQTFYALDSRGRNTAALVALDLWEDRLTVLAESDRVDIGGVLVHPSTKEVQAYSTNFAVSEWHLLDPSIAADLAYLGTVSHGELKFDSRSADDSRWLVHYTLANAPETYYLYERERRHARKLFTGTPQLEGLPLARMHPVVIKSRDGLDLVSYISLPRWTDPDEDGRPDRPLPMVLLVHGGPSDERAQYAFAPIVHAMTNRGYAFFFVNFRGSPGFGKAFMNAQRLEWGGKMHDDLIDQVAWTIEQGIADKDRVAIFGGSYGGYATLVGMTMTPDVFACGIDVVGPANLVTFMESIPAHWSLDHFALRVGDPRTEEGRAHLRARSPINFVHQVKSPILIAQGANDSRVPQAESDQMVDALVRQGVRVTYVLYPDEGHGFVRPENNRSFGAITEGFLATCLGGRFEPITDELEGSSVQVPVGAEHVPGLEEALARRVGDGLPAIAVDASVDPAVYVDYAGRYLLEGTYLITVTTENGRLFVEPAGQGKSEVLPRSVTEYAFTTVDASVRFVRDASGEVVKLVLVAVGGTEHEAVKQ